MTRILLDCDPGHDDMMAMMVASSHPGIELLGVTTVAGNQTGDRTFANAGKVLTLMRENDTPLARGCDHPLARELETAPNIHGVSGLDGADLPESTVVARTEHAVDFLERTLEAAEEPVTVVPTGPLTNIALLLRKNPAVAQKIERIVLMGGAVYDSNVTPAAEFNIYVDPEAAEIVFGCGRPITMVGLDVTNRAMLNLEEIDAVGERGGRVSRIVAPLLRFFAAAYDESFGVAGAPLHDALAVMASVEPDILSTRRLRVDVETHGAFTRGRTVVDVYGVTGGTPNADVAFELDVDRFKAIILDSIRDMDGRS
ncbi:MAG: nucleoside hydrolase [Spirochaetales bacterium]|nr:nucleoside hydrolase [Spirochaetales bacterium]